MQDVSKVLNYQAKILSVKDVGHLFTVSLSLGFFNESEL